MIIRLELVDAQEVRTMPPRPLLGTTLPPRPAMPPGTADTRDRPYAAAEGTSLRPMKLINFQEDAFAVHSLLHPIPVVSWLYTKVVLRAVAIFIFAAVGMTFAVLKWSGAAWNAAVAALGGDSYPVRPVGAARGVSVRRGNSSNASIILSIAIIIFLSPLFEIYRILIYIYFGL